MQQDQTHYDYIIAGAGCAGLSLAVHLIKSGELSDKKILLIDRDSKKSNDRTWCFWEKDFGLFQSIVFKQWSQLVFNDYNYRKDLQIEPYTYKMIRGIDFYQYCFNIINSAKNITFLQGDIDEILTSEKPGVVSNGTRYTAEFLFNSTFDIPHLGRKEYWLLQHFKGWKIKTTEPVFDVNRATLMDFATNQKYGPTFFYVLPFTETEALVEYTLFSEKLIDKEEYEIALENYINKELGIANFEIIEHESGVIPMTNVKFTAGNGAVINIGTAGGQTKGSSGYTFNFIQKHSAAIVACLKSGKHPITANAFSWRHHFYDSVLLNIFHNNVLPGNVVFTELFKKNNAGNVLEFLDNESTLSEEIKIISTLPVIPFAKAAVNQLLP